MGVAGGSQGKVVDLAEYRSSRVEPVWLTGRQLAGRWQVTVRTLERWRERGLPFAKQEHSGAVRYWLPDVEAWFRDN